MKLVYTSAVCIINDSKILLLKEKSNGKWGPPAGHSEDNEDFESTAIRETKEETNLDIHINGLIQALLLKKSIDKHYILKIYSAEVKDFSIIKIPEDEISEYTWATQEEIENGSFVLRDKVLKQVLVRAFTNSVSPIDTFDILELEEYSND